VCSVVRTSYPIASRSAFIIMAVLNSTGRKKRTHREHGELGELGETTESTEDTESKVIVLRFGAERSAEPNPIFSL